MRILFYSQSSTIYGSPASLVNLLSGLRELDSTLEVLVVIPSPGDLEKILLEEKIPFVIFPHSKWVYNQRTFKEKKRINVLFAYLWLYKNITQRYLKNLFKKKRHKELVKEYEPDLIYVNSSIAPMGCEIAIENKIPFYWHHRETVNDPTTGFFLDRPDIFKNYFKKADLHLYPSEFLKKFYERFYGHNHQVIFNGVPDASPSIPEKDEGQTIKFGMVGRINEQ